MQSDSTTDHRFICIVFSETKNLQPVCVEKKDLLNLTWSICTSKQIKYWYFMAVSHDVR